LGGLVIETLALSHFRSHRAARLTFDGRPVALVGPNARARRTCWRRCPCFPQGAVFAVASVEDFSRRPEALGWKVSASVQGLTAAHELETWAEPGESRQIRIDGKAATQASLGRVLRILWLVPAMDRLWIEAAEGRRRFLDRLTLSFFPDHAEHALTYEKAMRDRNRLIKDQVSDSQWYTALEAQMAEAGQHITSNRHAAIARVAEAADPDSAFPTAELALAGPEGSIEPDDLAAAFAESRRRDIAAGRTLVGPHRADLLARYAAKGVAANQCSTGEQKALLISLILANARALAEDLGRAPILLLDEVAAHLDESRRDALYDEICALGAQALMTGTEPELFSALGNRGQTVRIRDDHGLSQVRQ